MSHRLVLLIATLATALGLLLPVSALADPRYEVMNAPEGVYWRSEPNWAAAERISGFGVYNGTIIEVHCYQSGTAVEGSADTMWEQATDVGGRGYGSGWVNEHFINDGQPINQASPGVGPCNPPPPPHEEAPPPPHEEPHGSGLVFPIFNAEGGIYYRNSPHWADTPQTPGVGVYNGDQVQLICGAFGDPVGPFNDTAWSYVNNLSRSVGNGWVNEHFINDGAADNAFVGGEPMCGAETPGMSGPIDTGGQPEAPQSSPPATPTPAATGCPSYILFDSRGSGEPAGKLSPPGAAFKNEFGKHYPGIPAVENAYPAVGLTGGIRQIINLIGAGLGIGRLGAYHDSVVEGEKWLRSALANEVATCPSTHILLTGYSQGAQVTGDVVQRYVSAAEYGHITGVALFGDPYFNGTDYAVDRSTFEHGRNGILGVRHHFTHGSRVLSYCHKHDPICQLPHNAVDAAWYGLGAHENYPGDGVAAAKAMGG